MGTSASSSGPGSGVPLVPPWVSDAEFNNGTSPSVDSDNAPEDDFLPNNGDGNQPSQVQPQLAPPARFRSARRNLGEFSRSGNSKSLKKDWAITLDLALADLVRPQHEWPELHKTQALYMPH